MSEHPEHQSKQERGPKTLEAKWLDPECWDGCQSLKFKHRAERMREALEKIAKMVVAGRTPDRSNTERAIYEIARAALSDVTEEKQILSDCPEPLSQSHEDEGTNAQRENA